MCKEKDDNRPGEGKENCTYTLMVAWLERELRDQDISGTKLSIFTGELGKKGAERESKRGDGLYNAIVAQGFREENKRRNWAIVGINDMSILRDKLMEFSK